MLVTSDWMHLLRFFTTRKMTLLTKKEQIWNSFLAGEILTSAPPLVGRPSVTVNFQSCSSSTREAVARTTSYYSTSRERVFSD